jgi:hypothetical protein
MFEVGGSTGDAGLFLMFFVDFPSWKRILGEMLMAPDRGR